MRTIKFRSAHFNHDDTFYGFSYWGRLNYKWNPSMDEFTSPLSINSTYIKEDNQFTGITDKNGKEIYEGDIIDCPETEFYQGFRRWAVEYSDVWCSYGWTDGGAWYRLLPSQNYTIIGNIYENPELLK